MSRKMANALQQLFPAQRKGDAAPKWPNEFADRGYVILFTGRCGSTELVRALSRTALCGAPDEYFNEEFIPHHNAAWQCDDISAYVMNLVKARSAGRVFGFKIDGFRHRQLADFADPLAYFPKSAFKYIYLNRRDLLEQAYSYAHAKATGVWHRAQGTSDAAEDPVSISDVGIWREIALVLEQEFYFERYIIENVLDVLRIDYEMLCASKALVLAEVMLRIGCDPKDVGVAATLQESYRKIRYDTAKLHRLIEFRQKFSLQLTYLTLHRARLPLASVRNYLRTHASINLSRPDG